MITIIKLITFLSIPFAILNMAGGILSGVWLVILGDWGSIGYGMLAMVISSFGLGIALMPSALLTGAGVYFAEKERKILFYAFAFLDNIYIIAVMAAWCWAVFFFFVMRATGDTLIPVLIWSYGVALGPWQWITEKETRGGEGEASLVITLFAQIAYVAMILVFIFTRVAIIHVLTVFIVIMLIGMLFLFALNIQTMRISRLGASRYDDFTDV